MHARARKREEGVGVGVVAGFDGSLDAVQAIKDGKLLAASLQPAVQIPESAVEQGS